MDTSTIIAATGVVATLCAPIIGVAAARWSRNRHLNKISHRRKAALEGGWVGTGTQEVGPDGIGPFPTRVSATLKVLRKEVIGNFKYEFELNNETKSFNMELIGGFLYERYLRLNYNNQKATVIQFGSAVLELDNTATKLSGRFLGYGSETNGLVFGSVDLHKQP